MSFYAKIQPMPMQVEYRMVRRPKSPEDALALLQAWYDVAPITFFADSPESVAKLDVNPMVERVEPSPDTEPRGDQG